MDLYSVVCVSDRIKALEWFEVFFGRPADEVIGEEYLWRVGENAWVVIDSRPTATAYATQSYSTPTETASRSPRHPPCECARATSVSVEVP